VDAGQEGEGGVVGQQAKKNNLMPFKICCLSQNRKKHVHVRAAEHVTAHLFSMTVQTTVTKKRKKTKWIGRYWHFLRS